LYVPEYNKIGKTGLSESHKGDCDPETIANINAFMDEIHAQFFISYVIFVYMRFGPKVMPRIDTSMVSMILPTIFKTLKSAGYTIDSRVVERLFLTATQLCLFEAIHHVFFTTKHFPKGKPFRFNDVRECASYMCVTREHVWIALGQIFPSIVNPFIDDILLACHRMIEQKKEDERYSSRSQGQVTTIDYNYYFIDMTHMSGKTHFDVTNAFCDMIATQMNAMSTDIIRRIVTKELVIDAMHWLTRCLKESTINFKSDSTFEARPLAIPIPLFKERRHGKLGIELCREYLRDKITPDGQLIHSKSYYGLLQQCIYNTFGPETDLTKHYITGITFRAEGYPHIYRSVKRTAPVEVDSVSTLSLIGSRADPGYQFMIKHVKYPLPAEQATKKMMAVINKKNLGIDSFVLKRWADRVAPICGKRGRPKSNKFVYMIHPDDANNFYKKVDILTKTDTFEARLVHSDDLDIAPMGAPVTLVPSTRKETHRQEYHPGSTGESVISGSSSKASKHSSKSKRDKSYENYGTFGVHSKQLAMAAASRKAALLGPEEEQPPSPPPKGHSGPHFSPLIVQAKDGKKSKSKAKKENKPAKSNKKGNGRVIASTFNLVEDEEEL
jgi:hypothetical protein